MLRSTIMERMSTTGSSTFNSIARALNDAFAQIGRWRQLHRERAEIASLSDDRLRDIGLSRCDVRRESARPFWDDPLKR
ncbi:DUF1127 domain-containing protein [Pseudomonas sp. LB3P31]